MEETNGKNVWWNDIMIDVQNHDFDWCLEYIYAETWPGRSCFRSRGVGGAPHWQAWNYMVSCKRGVDK